MEDIDLPISLDDRVHHRFHLLGLGDVRFVEFRIASIPSDFIDGLHPGPLVEVDDAKLGALFREQNGGSSPDA